MQNLNYPLKSPYDLKDSMIWHSLMCTFVLWILWYCQQFRDFLWVQWLRLCISTAGGVGLIPGRETKIPHAPGQELKKKKQKKTKKNPQNRLAKGTWLFSEMISALLHGQVGRAQLHTGSHPCSDRPLGWRADNLRPATRSTELWLLRFSGYMESYGKT